MSFRFLCVMLTLTLALLSSAGCSDRLDLESAATPLALGIDLDPNNKFHFYSISPVFSKSIPKKSIENSGIARSLRQSRAEQDAQTGGAVSGRNFQVILVGKRILQQPDWFKIMDVIFRDSRNTTTDRMIAVDGPVAELIHSPPPDEPLIPILLRTMVNTNSGRGETVSTTIQELHRQMYDKGITPSIAEVQLHKTKIKMQGTVLLDKRGRYAHTLGQQDSVLLNILKGKAKAGVSLTFPVPNQPKTGPFDTDTVSFSAEKIDTKIKPSFKNSKFHFDIRIKITAALSERLFPYDMMRHTKELEKTVSKQTQHQFQELIREFQKHRIDPIGLGMYARAYEFKAFEQVKDHWSEELSRSDIHVTAVVQISSMGPVK
ncbi:Ger(x)C family spore germination protein [Paenibacillus rigui]|uniref:Spore gernimation protein GerC n=1 Tax=Paenibacillus rigui TaxID=554312 RepID=A0A229UUZ1_9BACL|nr:Ger(x)C family spore germination protein [Paenibacillus rigui]OXM87228.1 spore gernimation protein GerC [Paenibacillus rigui]